MYLCVPVCEFVLMDAVYMEARGGTEASASRVTGGCGVAHVELNCKSSRCSDSLAICPASRLRALIVNDSVLLDRFSTTKWNQAELEL